MDDLGDRPASGGWRSSGGGGSKRAVGVAGDAAEWETIDAMFAAARESFSAEADLVVINAGRGLRGSPISSDEKQWEEMIRVNLLAAARLTRAAAERMTREARGEGGERAPYGLRPAGEYSSAAAHEQARAASASAPADWPRKARDIVMISSTVGKHISPFSSMYGATKFAVTSMAEAARRELAPTGVRVSCVHPGVVRSEFQDVAGYDARTFGEFMERIGPVLEPADVARVVGFIAAQPAGVLVNDVMLRPTRQEYP
jgi:NADP-dependent 3-hydroxy acid dehydrogenase YdfG